MDNLKDSTSLSLLASGTILTLAVQPYDERIRSDWKNHQQMSQPVADAGNFLGTGIAGVLLAGGQYFFDPNAEHWKSHARTLIWQTSAVFLMKFSFMRKRPGRDNRESFPSGHTATAFATATNLTYSYGWQAGVIAFPAAALVGASRLADDMHWGSDVVAGAFVGVILARACTLDANPTSHAAQTRMIPSISPGFAGINYFYSF